MYKTIPAIYNNGKIENGRKILTGKYKVLLTITEKLSPKTKNNKLCKTHGHSEELKIKEKMLSKYWEDKELDIYNED